MKLTDIDENLAEAQPAGILARMGTKLKKHTPFNKAARDQAAGEEITQKAANELAGAYNIWLGRVKARGVNPKAVTVANLMDFFTKEGYANTAERVIKAAAEKKAPKKVEQPSEDEPTTTPSVGATNPQDAIPSNYGESLEARLASMLTEADEEQEVTFNPKEVNKLIMQIVATVEDEKPEALAQKVQSTAEPKSEPEPEAEAPAGEEVENIQQLEAMWDEMVRSLQMDDTSAQIMKAAFDNARKKVRSGEIGLSSK